VLFNPLTKRENEHMPDLNWREIAIAAPIVAAIIWLGVYPAPVLRRMEPAATKFVAQVRVGAPPVTAPSTTVAVHSAAEP
jgi:NADH-quinone oxidoreductase subunit M